MRLSPIPTGTLLENRYEVAQFLGYGGFGRTYLARDRQRFNELCVLKEFAPQINSPDVLRKAEELFQREAGTLYQLRHAQIPEFRAMLSVHLQGQDALLIVEQYVSGETYEQWVDAGNRLDEAGAIQFLKDLLPILTYIHNRGVVHRDISPDNLIREKNSQKPFLIDFGSVRQVATTAMQLSGLASATQIHKPGFSPREQLRGEVTPATDLYSLAVTTLVLVTGRSPLELYDDQLDLWHWRQFIRFTPGLEQLFDRMLATQVRDRIRSAADVSQALESIAGIPGLAAGDLAPYIPPQPIVDFQKATPTVPPIPAPSIPAPPIPAPANAPLVSPPSQMRTVAISPADPKAFPTTYPQRHGERQQNRYNDRNQLPIGNASNHGALVPQKTDYVYDDQSDRDDYPRESEDWVWSLIKLPWRMVVWAFKGLWMGVKAIDWVMTWVWRVILIGVLFVGGAIASYMWKAGSQQAARIEDTVRTIPSPPSSLPEFKLPEVKLPEIKMPDWQLPDVQIPNWGTAKSSNCAETIARYERSGLSKGQFYGVVDKRFRSKHPELDGRGLSDRPEDAGLRQEWCAIADQVLNEAGR